ncbi:MAG: preprotein translocase subunit YajC [Actinomycetota bacterium]
MNQTLLAQGSEPAKDATNPLVGFLPIVLLVVVFYFFMIRPQRNRMRQHQDLLSNLGLGDEVETIGGIYGTIRAMDEESFMLELAPGTVVRASRSAVRRKVYQPDEEEPSDSAT